MDQAQQATTLHRPLTADDRDQALDLLSHGISEVPTYRWLLGTDASEEAFRWYSDVLFTDHLPNLQGTFTAANDLVALIAVAGPDHETQPVSEELTAQTRHFLTTLDGFPERFVELRDKSRESTIKDSRSVVFALVHPDHRRHGALADLIEPVLDQAGREGVLITASTADEQMVAVYERKWNGEVYDQFTLTDGPTIWQFKVEPQETQT